MATPRPQTEIKWEHNISLDELELSGNTYIRKEFLLESKDPKQHFMCLPGSLSENLDADKDRAMEYKPCELTPMESKQLNFAFSQGCISIFTMALQATLNPEFYRVSEKRNRFSDAKESIPRGFTIGISRSVTGGIQLTTTMENNFFITIQEGNSVTEEALEIKGAVKATFELVNVSKDEMTALLKDYRSVTPKNAFEKFSEEKSFPFLKLTGLETTNILLKDILLQKKLPNLNLNKYKPFIEINDPESKAVKELLFQSSVKLLNQVPSRVPNLSTHIMDDFYPKPKAAPLKPLGKKPGLFNAHTPAPASELTVDKKDKSNPGGERNNP